jgi:hypothetical protein
MQRKLTETRFGRAPHRFSTRLKNVDGVCLIQRLEDDDEPLLTCGLLTRVDQGQTPKFRPTTEQDLHNSPVFSENNPVPPKTSPEIKKTTL